MNSAGRENDMGMKSDGEGFFRRRIELSDTPARVQYLI